MGNETSKELKPCPFCGGEADMMIGGTIYKAGCINDDCPENDSWRYTSEKAAIRAWNTRPDPWQPIGAAPKDKSEILIFNPNWDHPVKACWHENDAEESIFSGWGFSEFLNMGGCEDGFLGWSEDIKDGVMPTHWQPLPEPSKDIDKEKAKKDTARMNRAIELAKNSDMRWT